MTRSLLFRLVPLFLLVLAPRTALCQTTAPPASTAAAADTAPPHDAPVSAPPLPAAPPPPPLVAPPAPPAAPPVLIVPSVQLTVPWAGPTGEGVSVGLEEGGWSGVWGTGLRVNVPFISNLGARGGSFGATAPADAGMKKD